MIKLLCGLFLLTFNVACSQEDAKFGAYYFDGWTGTYPSHITDRLRNDFSEREPKWGWITSTPRIIDEQIQLAADAGLTFFSFCWYQYKRNEQPLNNALDFYLKSRFKSKLDFCLLVANHEGNEIDSNNWEDCSSRWLELFKDDSYVTVNGKPLLMFFTTKTLIKNFGSEAKVLELFKGFKQRAIEKGLKGVTLAACIGSSKVDIDMATAMGFDVLTGYNYHGYGINKAVKREVRIDTMQNVESKLWSDIISKTNLPYMPAVTLNWDARPWASINNNYDKEAYLTGFSAETVSKSVMACKKWMQLNKKSSPKEKLAILYAWNEYGEGAYLTPSKNGDNFLEGIKKVLAKKR